MYNLVNNKANFTIAVPESLDEITPKVLENLTKDIKLPKYYCIVALAYQTTSFDLAFLGKNSKPQTIKVTPILAKYTETFKEEFKVGDGLVINKSDIELATHCPINTKANISRMIDFINSDSELAKNVLLVKFLLMLLGLNLKLFLKVLLKELLKLDTNLKTLLKFN